MTTPRSEITIDRVALNADGQLMIHWYSEDGQDEGWAPIVNGVVTLPAQIGEINVTVDVTVGVGVSHD